MKLFNDKDEEINLENFNAENAYTILKKGFYILLSEEDLKIIEFTKSLYKFFHEAPVIFDKQYDPYQIGDYAANKMGIHKIYKEIAFGSFNNSYFGIPVKSLNRKGISAISIIEQCKLSK